MSKYIISPRCTADICSVTVESCDQLFIMSSDGNRRGCRLLFKSLWETVGIECGWSVSSAECRASRPFCLDGFCWLDAPRSMFVWRSVGADTVAPQCKPRNEWDSTVALIKQVRDHQLGGPATQMSGVKLLICCVPTLWRHLLSFQYWKINMLHWLDIEEQLLSKAEEMELRTRLTNDFSTSISKQPRSRE